MKRLLIILVFLAYFWNSSSVLGATYCMSNSGTAGSKTAATDCSDMTKCMNETVFNGETFAGDTVLVCPNDGELDLSVILDQTVYIKGVYDPILGFPTFGQGLNATAGTNPSVERVRIKVGIAESGTKTFEGVRIADTSRNWQAAEETPVIDWDKSNVIIVAGGIGVTGGGASVTPEIRWRDKTDSGSWTALGASGEIKQAATTALTDNANLATANFGTSSGKTKVTGVQCEQEDSGIAGASTSLSADEYTELQVGASLADGNDGHEYAFALFESGAQIGPESSATITTIMPSYCSGEAQQDMGCEDFEGTEAIPGVDGGSHANVSGWTALEGVSCALSFDTHDTGGGWSCSEKGSYALKATITGSSQDCLIWRTFSPVTSYRRSIYFNIPSWSPSSGDKMMIYKLRDNAGEGNLILIYIEEQSGVWDLAVSCNDDGSPQEQDANVSLADDTQYHLEIQWIYNQATDGCKVTISNASETELGYVQDDGCVGCVSGDASPDYEYIGPENDTVYTGNPVFEWDMASSDDDTMPGDCN